MKRLYTTLFTLITAALIMMVCHSCKKDDTEGTPLIRYVRITDAEAADSLITGSSLGSTVAIVGENLGKAREVWFNNRLSVLIPTYVTDQSLIVRVPDLIPTDVTHKLKVVFSNGQVLEHDFRVQVSSPQVASMENEFALEGEVTTIRGNFFYPPLKVTFTGGAEAEVVSVEDQMIEIRVPDGVQPGPITVASPFGESRSNFYYRDNRNVLIDSDPWIGANANWGSGFVVTAPGPGDPPKISGNYIRVKQFLAPSAWVQVAGGFLGSNFAQQRSIRTPAEAITNPERYYLKFEVNTMKPYNGSMIRLNFGLPTTTFVGGAYLWSPPYDSKGKWQTITIPFEDLVNAYKAVGVTPVVTANGQYHTSIVFNHASSLDCDMSFDTFRIVPKVAAP